MVVRGSHFLEAIGHAMVFRERQQHFGGARRQRIGDALDFLGVPRRIRFLRFLQEGVQGEVRIVVPAAARARAVRLLRLVDEGDGQDDVVRVCIREVGSAGPEAERIHPGEGEENKKGVDEEY